MCNMTRKLALIDVTDECRRAGRITQYAERLCRQHLMGGSEFHSAARAGIAAHTAAQTRAQTSPEAHA